jgi:hypothetical protein
MRFGLFPGGAKFNRENIDENIDDFGFLGQK